MKKRPLALLVLVLVPVLVAGCAAAPISISGGEPPPPTPFAIADSTGKVTRARGPIDIRHPVTGRIYAVPAGAELVFGPAAPKTKHVFDLAAPLY